MVKIAVSDPVVNIPQDGEMGSDLRLMHQRLKRLQHDRSSLQAMRSEMQQLNVPVSNDARPEELVGAYFRNRLLKHYLEDPVAASDTLTEIRYYMGLNAKDRGKRAAAYSRQYVIDASAVDKTMRLFDKVTRDITFDTGNSEHYQQQEKKQHMETGGNLPAEEKRHLFDIPQDSRVEGYVLWCRDGLKDLKRESYLRSVRSELARRSAPVPESATPEEVIAATFRSIIVENSLEAPSNADEIVSLFRRYKLLEPQEQEQFQQRLSRQYKITPKEVATTMQLLATASEGMMFDRENYQTFEKIEQQRRKRQEAQAACMEMGGSTAFKM